MIAEIKVPSPGESITEVEIGHWLVEDGSVVAKNQEIAEVESDKATLTVIAEEGGKIKLLAQEGDKVAVGSVVCSIDTSLAEAAVTEKKVKIEKPVVEPKPEAKVETPKPEKEVRSLAEYENVKITSVAKEMMKGWPVRKK